MSWITKACDQFTCKIYIAGDYNEIKSVCREYCSKGFCVSLAKYDYIYKYGEESGACLTIINYPRFPENKNNILSHARKLGLLISEKCNQGSFTIETPEEMFFHSRRGYE